MLDWLIKIFFQTVGKPIHSNEHREIRAPLIPAIAPDAKAEDCKNRGNERFSKGDLESAEQCYLDAIALKTGYAEAYNNLGLVYQAQQKYAEAEHSLRQAVLYNPRLSNAYFNLGTISKVQGRPEDALAHFAKALEIKPDYAEAWKGAGDARFQLGLYSEASDAYRRALSIKPDYVEVWNNLGAVYSDWCRLDEAIDCYKHALAIVPEHPAALSNLIYSMNFSSSFSAEEIFREHQKLAWIYRAKTACTNDPHANYPNPERRLRIGYVSGDFRLHAVAYFFEPLLVYRDVAGFEVFCYSNTSGEDEVTARLKSLADHWRNIFSMTDEQAVETIRRDQIDILVDLSGNTYGNRLSVFACKPAPLQVTWLGYPNTTGLPAMDYRITDRHADPDGADAYYTERLKRLPDSLWCYRPAADMPNTSPLPALARGYLTFGSFNSFNKIDRTTLKLWAELLRALPTARLMMLTVPEGENRLRLIHSFAELGIDAQRLEFHGKLPAADFHRKFLEVDITLDPVFVNGGTTTCESLWMGVPVISLVGKRFLSRAGLSLLSTAGFAEFAVSSPEDYIRLAAKFADNLPLLAEIRAGLRTRLKTSPLLDAAKFTRELESIYRQIWVEWCSKCNRDTAG